MPKNTVLRDIRSSENQQVVDYIRAFVEFHLGSSPDEVAVAFTPERVQSLRDYIDGVADKQRNQNMVTSLVSSSQKSTYDASKFNPSRFATEIGS